MLNSWTQLPIIRELVIHPPPLKLGIQELLTYCSATPQTSLPLLREWLSTRSYWVGGKELDWSIQYKIFKKYKILSDRILRDDTIKAARRAAGKDSSDSIDASKKKKFGKKKKAPTVIVLGGLSDRPTRVRIQEPSVDQVTIADVPVALPITRQIRDEAIEVSDLESEARQKER